MIKAILFDLDGTLLDTVEDIRVCLNAVMRKFGYPEASRGQTCAYIGDGAFKLLERALPQGADNAQECYEMFASLYAENKNTLTKPFEGAEAFLQKCVERGLKTAIITNKPQEATQNCVKQFFKHKFDFVSGDSGAFPCKPDPSLALYAALTMRVAPAECVFVGDGETDALTAKYAGMFGISVLWGYRSRKQLEEAGATRFACDFAELEKIVFQA